METRVGREMLQAGGEAEEAEKEEERTGSRGRRAKLVSEAGVECAECAPHKKQVYIPFCSFLRMTIS